KAWEPARVGTPATSRMSLTPKGMPRSGPPGSPRATARSASRAASRASSAATLTHAFRRWSLASISSRHACTSSTGDSCRASMSAAASTAVRSATSPALAATGYAPLSVVLRLQSLEGQPGSRFHVGGKGVLHNRPEMAHKHLQLRRGFLHPLFRVGNAPRPGGEEKQGLQLFPGKTAAAHRVLL